MVFSGSEVTGVERSDIPFSSVPIPFTVVAREVTGDGGSTMGEGLPTSAAMDLVGSMGEGVVPADMVEAVPASTPLLGVSISFGTFAES